MTFLMYAVPGCWAGLLGADCDYSPNPLNGTLQHKIVFVITFLIVKSSVKQPLKKKKYLMCGCPCWKGFFFYLPSTHLSYFITACVVFPDFHKSYFLNMFDSNACWTTLIKAG